MSNETKKLKMPLLLALGKVLSSILTQRSEKILFSAAQVAAHMLLRLKISIMHWLKL
jgi:hypothetical protein